MVMGGTCVIMQPPMTPERVFTLRKMAACITPVSHGGKSTIGLMYIALMEKSAYSIET